MLCKFCSWILLIGVCLVLFELHHEKTMSSGFLTSSDTNKAIQPQRMVRGLKFWILEVEGLCYLCSENKGAII